MAAKKSSRSKRPSTHKTHPAPASETPHAIHHNTPEPADDRTMMLSVTVFVGLLIAYVAFYTYTNVKPSYIVRNSETTSPTPVVFETVAQPTPVVVGPTVPPPKVNKVVIAGPTFSPETVRVKKDSIVMWVNESGSTVMLTISLKGVKREEVAPKNMVAYIFTEPGRYSFQSSTNPQKTGQIIVE